MTNFCKLNLTIYLNEMLFGFWLHFAPKYFSIEEINRQIDEVEAQNRALCQKQGI